MATKTARAVPTAEMAEKLREAMKGMLAQFRDLDGAVPAIISGDLAEDYGCPENNDGAKGACDDALTCLDEIRAHVADLRTRIISHRASL